MLGEVSTPAAGWVQACSAPRCRHAARSRRRRAVGVGHVGHVGNVGHVVAGPKSPAVLAVKSTVKKPSNTKGVGNVGYLFLIANIANKLQFAILIKLILLAMLAMLAPVFQSPPTSTIYSCCIYTTLFYIFLYELFYCQHSQQNTKNPYSMRPAALALWAASNSQHAANIANNILGKVPSKIFLDNVKKSCTMKA